MLAAKEVRNWSPRSCCSKAELGFDAQAEGILHSTSEAQLSPVARLQKSNTFSDDSTARLGSLHTPLIKRIVRKKIHGKRLHKVEPQRGGLRAPREPG